MSGTTFAPVGARIKSRLEQANISQDKLVSMVRNAGVTAFDKTKLSKSLKGERQFTSEEIAFIADMLALDAYFLVTGNHPAHEPRVAARHEFIDGNHVADWSECLRQVRAVSTAYRQVELVGDSKFQQARSALNAPDGTPRNYEAGRVLAASLRKQWEASPYTDIALELTPFLESALGIDVIIVDGKETNRVQAQAFEILDNQVIVSIQSGSWYSAVFAVMHEVAHLLFDDLFHHDPETSIDLADSERYANAFAADFLMPMSAMRDFETADVEEFAHTAWKHGVGVGSILARAEATKRAIKHDITQVELNKLFAKLYGYDRLEERQAFWRTPRFPKRLISAHSEAVAGGRLDPTYLAWMQGVPVEELEPPRVVSDEEAADRFLALL